MSDVVSSSLMHRVAGLVLTSASRPMPSRLQQRPFRRRRPRATFRSAVEVVTVSASVRTGGGKVVRDLEQADFEVLDTGKLVDDPRLLCRRGPHQPGAPARHQRQHGRGRQHGPRPPGHGHGADQPAHRLGRSRDVHVRQSLREVVDFSTDLSTVNRVDLAGKPWGITSLYDAIATAARRVAQRSNRHRALLVITDGVDTGSKLTAPQVSGIASSIDVPVYVLAVVNPVDHPEGEFQARPSNTRGDRTGRPRGSVAVDRRRGLFCKRAQSRVDCGAEPGGGVAPSVPDHLRAWGAAWMASPRSADEEEEFGGACAGRLHGRSPHR